MAFICTLKYHFNPKRTFKFVFSKLNIKSWLTSTIEIIRIGFPGASMGIFDVILVYIMNLILGGLLGNLGLDIYNVCVNALLIISILIIGFAETLSSIVPIYYSQNDFYNLNHIVRRSIIAAMICSILFTVFLWIYPDGLLIFYKLSEGHHNALIENAIRLYSLSFIPIALSNILIFYYEGIERTVESGIISVISTLIGPLLFTFLLYPIIGLNGIWLSFLFGITLSLIVNALYVKYVERKETEYSGLFYIKKDLIPKTRNYTIKNRDDEVKTEMFNHLKSLNDDKSSLESLNKIINTIFDSNNDKISIEVLLIDYDDKISVNFKDEGTREVLENIKKSFSEDENISISEVLGFNNIEYTIMKS